MNNLVCPKCRLPLQKDGKSLICEKKHTFDISKKGYVNLLCSGGKNHGDDKLMIQARRDFLSGGFYDKLSLRLCEISNEYCKNGIIVDAGCGEGKYTTDIENYLKSHSNSSRIYAFDVSKEAVHSAASRMKDAVYFVASSSDIPLSNKSCDLLLCIFSPFMKEEFLRILKDNGKLVIVYPLRFHLFELKEAVYENPYENEPMENEFSDLTLLHSEEIKYEIELRSNADIQNLFKMTPYYYKTSKEDMEKLSKLETLKTRVEFGIAVYEKMT